MHSSIPGSLAPNRQNRLNSQHANGERNAATAPICVSYFLTNVFAIEVFEDEFVMKELC
jgi:hypothetical protein